MSGRRLSPLLAWPLRRRDLVNALGADFPRVDFSWWYWQRAPSVVPLSVTWSWAMPELDPLCQPLTVWLKPVRQEDRDVIREVLLAAALPSLATWVADTNTATETWLDSRHERRWRVEGGAVRVLDADGSATQRRGTD